MFFFLISVWDNTDESKNNTKQKRPVLGRSSDVLMEALLLRDTSQIADVFLCCVNKATVFSLSLSLSLSGVSSFTVSAINVEYVASHTRCFDSPYVPCQRCFFKYIFSFILSIFLIIFLSAPSVPITPT